jgi:hypothetical protein
MGTERLIRIEETSMSELLLERDRGGGDSIREEMK